MKVVIVGYGWLGRQLAPILQSAGHHVFVTKRNREQLVDLPTGIKGLALSLGENNTPAPDVLAAMHNAMVICAVTPGRRSPAACYESALTELAILLKQAGASGVIHFSSSGIYDGLKGDVDESAELNECSERAQKLLAGERAIQQAPCCITLRLAGLIGPGRHPGHFVAGKALNEPEAPVNMVHSEDIIAAVSLLLEQDVLSGNIFNLNCPDVVSRRVFYTQAVQDINADIIFSSENLAGDASGRRVNPNKFIQAYGYHYRFKSACDALQHCD